MVSLNLTEYIKGFCYLVKDFDSRKTKDKKRISPERTITNAGGREMKVLHSGEEYEKQLLDSLKEIIQGIELSKYGLRKFKTSADVNVDCIEEKTISFTYIDLQGE